MFNLAGAIIDILLERKGFDDWWENIDEENRAEIFALIEKAIQDASQ